MITEILAPWVIGVVIMTIIIVGLIGALIIGIKLYDWIKEDPIKNSIITFIVIPLCIFVPYFLGKFVLGW